MSSNEGLNIVYLNIVYTCEICGEILDDYENHPCFEGYSDMRYDENHYLFPVTEDGIIVRRSQLNDNTEAVVGESMTSARGTENVCPNQRAPTISGEQGTSMARKRQPPAKPNEKLNDVDIELLILEVQRRIPLWNISIPIQQRSREAVSKLWREVSIALGGKINAADAKKKFNAHVDEGGDQPSGVPRSKKTKGRSTKDDESLLVLNRIADAMSREEPLPPPPSPPQMDDVDGFLLGVATHLRRLPAVQRMETIVELLNIVLRKCQEFLSDS